VYPLRSITFTAELIYPQRNHNIQQLQKVHSLAFADAQTRYANFQVIAAGVQLSNPPTQAGAVSAAVILPDRLRIQEQLTGVSRDDFQARVENLARMVLEELQIPNFVAQQFLVQSLINPRSATNSAQFLAESVFQLPGDSFDVFERRPNLLGMRLAFPMTAEHPELFNVRIENYDPDPRSLFIENVGVFKVVVGGQNLNVLGQLFEKTYDHMGGPVVDFIAQFDGTSDL
jgi:hypothetical protein